MEKVDFQPLGSPDRLPDRVIEQIKKFIEDGVLNVGDRLPSERELARQLSIGRTSVREALRTLEALGIIEVRSGAGAFITGRAKNSAGATAENWFSNWPPVEHKGEIMAYYEVREALETKAAQLAARRASYEDVLRMQAASQKLERAVETKDIVRMVLADIEFHDSISQATKNPILVSINQAINRLLLEVRYVRLENLANARESCQDHANILKAIASHDSDTASTGMLYHIRRTTNEIAETLEDKKGVAVDRNDVLNIAASLGTVPLDIVPSGGKTPGGNERGE